MIHDVADDPSSLTPSELRQQYEAELQATIEEVGVETVAERSGIDRERIDEIKEENGGTSDIELTDAAAILATREGTPNAESIAMEARDVLLMGMTTAVLDVDTLESEINGQIEAKEIQQKMEGRFSMTLGEYALLQQAIEGRSP